MKKNKRHIKPIAKIISGIICLILFSITSILFAEKGFNNFITKTVYYNEDSTLNYKVYLNDNEYFKEPYLGENLQYIANLINHVELDFNYKYSA